MCYNNIKKLKKGDEILFTDLDNRSYQYSVSYEEVINENDTKKIEAGSWGLSLFTCTKGGRERFVLRCVRKAGLGNPSSAFLCIYL